MKDETIKILKNIIIQWKKEYEILDSIIETKDAKIAELKAEEERLKRELSGKRFICPQCMEFAKEIHKYQQTLKEIKAITENSCRMTDKDLCDNNSCAVCKSISDSDAIEQILQKIIKAESEG